MGWYALLVGAAGVERLAELRLSVRHARWAVANGGVEFGRGHYPLMVALHIGLLGGCLAEVALLDRPFIPALGWPALAVVLAAQGLRWWCIASLGPQWNTRVIVVPGMPLVARGPYRWRRLPHPNYLAVVVEGLALPLVHTAWLTATLFTLLNTPLLAVRIRCEDVALGRRAPRKPAGAVAATAG